MLHASERNETVAQPKEHQPGEERFRVIHSEDVMWKPFPAFPPAVRLAILAGPRPG